MAQVTVAPEKAAPDKTAQERQRFNPLLLLLGALAMLFFIFPLAGLITGAPWGHIASVITSKAALQALELSIVASLASTGLALIFGFPLAWLLARGNFRGKGLVRGLTTLPMVLPPVVGGIALLLAYGRKGFIGRPLENATGITLPFTLAGVIVAESFVAMPFFVITVESGLRSMNRRLEDAARSLGANRRTVFLRVTLPLIWPSLAAGTVLTWARALGEFGATITFAGNLPGVTQTMPLAIYISQSSNQTDQAIALSLILVLVSLVVMIFRRDRSGGR
jgi:molybdate transport system permease protein